MKKIFVFMMAMLMVCGLALPIFAIEPADANPIVLYVIDYDGNYTTIEVTAKDGMTVKDVVKQCDIITLSSTKGITKINGKDAKTINSPFGGSWTIALNGQTADLANGVSAGDTIIVYWNEPIFYTKIVMTDLSKIDAGIISFYYYKDNERMPLTDASVVIEDVRDMLNGSDAFITDEKGQIWIAPLYLDSPDLVYTIKSISIEPLEGIKDTDTNYTTTQKDYFNARLNNNIIAVDVINSTFSPMDYNDAPATGDMTLAYAGIGLLALVALMGLLMFKNKNAHQVA